MRLQNPLPLTEEEKQQIVDKAMRTLRQIDKAHKDAAKSDLIFGKEKV